LHQNILLRSPETLAPQPDALDLQQNNSSQELANVDGQPANSSRFPKKGFSAAQQTCSVPGKSCSDADYSWLASRQFCSALGKAVLMQIKACPTPES
jgi:hypothetical protein